MTINDLKGHKVNKENIVAFTPKWDVANFLPKEGLVNIYNISEKELYEVLIKLSMYFIDNDIYKEIYFIDKEPYNKNIDDAHMSIMLDKYNERINYISLFTNQMSLNDVIHNIAEDNSSTGSLRNCLVIVGKLDIDFSGSSLTVLARTLDKLRKVTKATSIFMSNEHFDLADISYAYNKIKSHEGVAHRFEPKHSIHKVGLSSFIATNEYDAIREHNVANIK